jgi:dolichyl-phosphate-mannose-protein mannosyltransferase
VTRPSRFWLGLAALTLLAFAVRLAYGLAADLPRGLGDDIWYHSVANGLVDGRGFSDPFRSIGPNGILFGTAGDPIPTAFHPPLFPWLLAVLSELGLRSYTAHLALGWAFGAGTVLVIGLIGRRLGGERAGLLAALAGALYLPLAINDSLGMSESLYGLTIALVLLAALRFHERPDARRAAWLGAAIGVAALTRKEALVLVVLLAPLVVRAAPRGWRRLGITAAVAVVLLLPWSIRSSLEFDRPVFVSTADGSVIAGANLPSTYHGDMLGGWDFNGLYSTPTGRADIRNEAVQSERWRREGIDYALDHAGRLPVVIAARLGRTWSVYPFAPADKAQFASDNYDHMRRTEYAAMLAYLAALLLAAYGFPTVPRQLRWLLLAPVALVMAVSVLGFGDLRFRQAADVVLALLAGLGVARFLARRQAEGAGTSSGAPAGPGSPSRLT